MAIKLHLKGLTIVAENINRMRYMSHFRAVHRGAFFQEMRTTDVRQLLPDAWGFICPVHTPDGAPCGLLNHLTMNCIVTDTPNQKHVDKVPLLLTELGMIPLKTSLGMSLTQTYTVHLDGKIIGCVPKDEAKKLVNKLRLYKVQGDEIPNTMEIVLVPLKKVSGQFPGIFLFTGPARMMRPLVHLATKNVEFVGTFEQIYMDVCISPEEFYPGFFDLFLYIFLNKICYRRHDTHGTVKIVVYVKFSFAHSYARLQSITA